MLKLPANVRIFISTEPCDMRRQFDGLAALVRTGMDRDPESGDLYIFRNRKSDIIKVLFFDRHGYCMLAKRLTRGSFKIRLDANDGAAAEVSAQDLARLLSELALEGVDVARQQRPMGFVRGLGRIGAILLDAFVEVADLHACDGDARICVVAPGAAPCRLQ